MTTNRKGPGITRPGAKTVMKAVEFDRLAQEIGRLAAVERALTQGAQLSADGRLVAFYGGGGSRTVVAPGQRLASRYPGMDGEPEHRFCRAFPL